MAAAHAAELRAVTSAAWEAYVRAADQRMQARVSGAAPFLWLDEAPGRSFRAKTDGVLVGPGMGNGTQNVPNGLIHHWIAVGFVPGATRASVLQVVHDYRNYKRVYSPPIIDSKVVSCGDDEQCFSLRSLNRVLFVTAVFETQCKAREFQVDARRWYSMGGATRVQEVENYGQADERMLAPGSGRGYLWGLHTITRYEERDGGVYIEMEAIALSRRVPVSLEWLVNPVIAKLSENSLMTTVRQTREAVMAATRAERRRSPGVGNNSPFVAITQNRETASVSTK